MEIQPFDEQGDGAYNPRDGLRSSLSSLSRESSGASSNFSELFNAWEAELELMDEVGKTQMPQRASGAAGASTSTNTRDAGVGLGDNGASTSASASGGGSGDADDIDAGIDSVTSIPSGSPHLSQTQSTPSLPSRKPRRLTTATSISSQSTTTNSPKTPGPPHRTSLAAGFGATSRGSCYSARSSVSRATWGSAQGWRRAAFVAGSIASAGNTRKPGSSTPGRDILLPRLPSPALDLIVPALPAATRAALRCTCKALRTLVDTHTHALTFRPDRRAADDLNRRGTKAFAVFPALRRATVVLAGSCSGPTGLTTAATA
ncbi:hypothetical protein Vretimale_14576, partial [Volvox reticuliferus]